MRIGDVISTGLKQVVIPTVMTKVSNSLESDSEIDRINRRIERLDKLREKQNEVSDTANLSTNSKSTSIRDNVPVSCLACARSHISTCSALLKEAVRFSRDEGITNEEVQKRIGACEEEITALERFDWSPEQIINSPEDEQEIIRELQPRLRKLRQDITTANSPQDIEQIAADAGNLSTDFRMKVLTLENPP